MVTFRKVIASVASFFIILQFTLVLWSYYEAQKIVFLHAAEGTFILLFILHFLMLPSPLTNANI